MTGSGYTVAVRKRDDENPMTDRVEVRCREEWLRAVDEWRRKQPEIPSRNEAIRVLVERGLDADAKSQAKTKVR